MSQLFEETTIKSMSLPNRFVRLATGKEWPLMMDHAPQN